MANTIGKTPIVYYGGKTAILPHLLEMEPVHNLYTETFLGGGSLFWSKTPVKNETINDRLDIVINFYRTLRHHYKPLKRLIDATLIGRSIHRETLDIIHVFKKKYGANIKKLNVSQRVNLAWAFWVRTNFSQMNKINGGYKQEKGGGRSIAQSLQRRKEAFTELLVARIENTCIENTGNFIKVLNARNTPTGWHSLDPPYPETYQESYTYFGDPVFTWEDYEKILHWCAHDCTGKFLLNSYPNALLSEYVRDYGWNEKKIVHQLKAPRKGGTQLQKIELLISNYSTCETLRLFP